MTLFKEHRTTKDQGIRVGGYLGRYKVSMKMMLGGSQEKTSDNEITMSWTNRLLDTDFAPPPGIVTFADSKIFLVKIK